MPLTSQNASQMSSPFIRLLFARALFTLLEQSDVNLRAAVAPPPASTEGNENQIPGPGNGGDMDESGVVAVTGRGGPGVSRRREGVRRRKALECPKLRLGSISNGDSVVRLRARSGRPPEPSWRREDF